MVITYRFDGMFDRSLDIGGIGEGLDTKEGERNKRNMKFFQIFKICFVEIENRIINGENKKKSKRNFYYSISVFSMSFWNLMETLERILAMYIKRWWNFEIPMIRGILVKSIRF